MKLVEKMVKKVVLKDAANVELEFNSRQEAIDYMLVNRIERILELEVPNSSYKGSVSESIAAHFDELLKIYQTPLQNGDSDEAAEERRIAVDSV